MTLRQTLAILSCYLIAWGVIAQPADALPFRKKKPEDPAVQQVRTYQPPPENAVTIYCDPYRKETAVLSKKPWFLKPFYEPRRLWLMSKYRKCTDNLMVQEQLYLKHVDIEQSPSLPKLKIPAQPVTPISQPGEGNANQL